MAQTDDLPEFEVINDRKQGDTFPGLRFTITRNGVAKDLTGATITMKFLHRNRRTGEDQTLTIGNGLTLVDGPNGIFDMDQIGVLDWMSGEYTWEAEIQYSDGEIKTPVEGTWKIHQDKINNS
jgi:hypothetical protein